MDASTPWRSQQLLESKQTPRPRPPAFALRSRRPSANQTWKADTVLPVAPPPYRKDVDATVVTAARSLGLSVGEAEAATDAEFDEDEAADGQRESRDEMRKRLKALEKRLGEREKELSLAAQIGQSLLSTNESLRTQHETLLQSLPPAISNTVDRLSAPPAISRAWKTDLPSTPRFCFPSSAPTLEDGDLPEDLKRTLSELEIDTALVSPLDVGSPMEKDAIRGLPRRPPLSTFASSSSSSSHARSHSYARLQLQELAEQNHDLLSRLTEVEEEDEARRRKMRKLETEIGRLRAELEKAEERREDDTAGLSSSGLGFQGYSAFSEPAKPLWQRRGTQTKKADQENIPVQEPTLHIAEVEPVADFSNGTPEPQPILRRSRRQTADLPDERPITAPSRLANEKSKAALIEADNVLTRAGMLRSVSRHRSTMSMDSLSSSPLSVRGSGNRQMIGSQRKVRKRVSRSSFLGIDAQSLPSVDQSMQNSSSSRPAKAHSQVSSASSTLRLRVDSPLRTRRGSTLSPGGSPASSTGLHWVDPSHCRTLGSELGSEFGDDMAQGLPGLELLGQSMSSDAESVASTTKLELSTSIAISALAVALAPASALVTDSSTPILPHGAFKQDAPMDSRTFDLLDQAVCERSMRWADDEKDAEDEMLLLDVSDDDEPDDQSWALTRYKPTRTRTSEKALVKRPRSSRPLPPPSRPHGAPFGLLGWGQASDPWESTLYSDDDGALTPPRRSRSASKREFAPPSMAIRNDPLSASLSVRVRHSRSLSVARFDPASVAHSLKDKSTRAASRRSLPERVVGKAIELLVDVWIFMQFIVVVGVFLWVTLRKGPRAILGAETSERRIGII